MDLNNALLGEHYLEILKWPIPTSGNLITTQTSVDVLDKSSSAISITGYTTRDAASDANIFYNEVTFFMRGAGGFGGSRSLLTPRPSSKTYATPPQNATGRNRSPDKTLAYTTSEEQAALYRLTGDREAMHIDPATAQRGGHPRPILHGVCTMGIAGFHLYKTYGPFRAIKVRFVGVVLPGQTLKMEFWRDTEESDLVLFQVKVEETGRLCISGGWARLMEKSEDLARL